MMDTYMNWRMFTNEDNLEGTDRLYNKYLDIFVNNPRTHIKKGRALYTDYEVVVKTNHPEFAIKESNVRRRYSHFVWLKNKLGMNDVMMVTAPSLPGKRYIGRFKDQFLKKRQFGLQSFMNKVVEINAFLSDPALHLFLQTELSIPQMDSYLQCGMHLSNIRDRILIAVQKTKEHKRKTDNHYQKEANTLKSYAIKKTRSIDSITLKEKQEWEKIKLEAGGRGWSRYIGDSTKLYTGTEVDFTDFQKDIEHQTQIKRMSGTACVLPGGRLQLAREYKESITTKNASVHRRSVSWHGHNNDIVDIILDSYDILEKPDNDYEVTSCSVSSSSINDNDKVVDDLFDLNEYNVISMPEETKHSDLIKDILKQSFERSSSLDVLSKWDDNNSVSVKWVDVSESFQNDGFHHSASYSVSSDDD